MNGYILTNQENFISTLWFETGEEIEIMDAKIGGSLITGDLTTTNYKNENNKFEFICCAVDGSILRMIKLLFGVGESNYHLKIENIEAGDYNSSSLPSNSSNAFIYWNSVTTKTIANSDSDNDYGLKNLDLEVFILDGPEPEPEPEPYQLYMLVFDRFYSNDLNLKIVNFYGEEDPIDIGEHVDNNTHQSTPLSINDIRFVTGWNGNCLLYTSPSPRDPTLARKPTSA